MNTLEAIEKLINTNKPINIENDIKHPDGFFFYIKTPIFYSNYSNYKICFYDNEKDEIIEDYSFNGEDLMTELGSEDWEESSIKFFKAMDFLKKGYSIFRKAWIEKNKKYIAIEYINDNYEVILNNGEQYALTTEDLNADDWMIGIYYRGV